jgi:ATP-binding protein involved in chromosome partitioning
MSAYVCPQCGKQEALFGEGGGQRISDFFAVPLLGQVPLVPEVRESGDAGLPIVLAQPDHTVSQTFRQIARAVLEEVEAAREPAPRIVG